MAKGWDGLMGDSRLEAQHGQKGKKIFTFKIFFHDNNLDYQLDEAKNREALSLHKNCQESMGDGLRNIFIFGQL